MEWLGQVLHCQLYGRPGLVLVHVIGDVGTFLAYTAIPVAILIVMKRRAMSLHKFRLSGLFAAFIVSCGVGHLLDAVSLWYPIPVLQGWWDLSTAIISGVTVIYIFKLIPALCRLPNWEEYLQQRIELLMYRDTEFWTTLEIGNGSNGVVGELDVSSNYVLRDGGAGQAD